MQELIDNHYLAVQQYKRSLCILELLQTMPQVKDSNLSIICKCSRITEMYNLCCR
jgi:hypothetical protein